MQQQNNYAFEINDSVLVERGKMEKNIKILFIFVILFYTIIYPKFFLLFSFLFLQLSRYRLF